IISRAFGTTIGAAIGISLYLSQAVSVAFYMIAFAEAFRPLFPWIQEQIGWLPDPRMISLPATLFLIGLMLTKGADLGVKALWGWRLFWPSLSRYFSLGIRQIADL
ncbi:MAG: hypothetical protein ACO36I_17060, partial [Candidatus Latescibacterota bacterium]